MYLKRKKTLMCNIYQYLNNPVETFYVINEKYNIDSYLRVRRTEMTGVGERTKRVHSLELCKIHIYSTRSC